MRYATVAARRMLARLTGDWHGRRLQRSAATARWHLLRLQVRALLPQAQALAGGPARLLAVASLPTSLVSDAPAPGASSPESSATPPSAGWAGQQRLVAGAVAVLVLVASVIGVNPVHGPADATGNVLGPGTAPRLAVGGASVTDGSLDGTSDPAGSGSGTDGVLAFGAGIAGAGQQSSGPAPAGSSVDGPDIEAFSDNPGSGSGGVQPSVDLTAGDPTESTDQGPYLADGTILKPIAVDTTIPDARELLTTYKVRKGDTLTSIAHHFGLSLVTLFWANHLTTDLKTNADLKVGRTLSIPPVNGVLHIVTDNETLTDISRRTGVSVKRIVDANGLTQPTVFVGQWIIVPGAKAKPIPVAAPKPKPVSQPRAGIAASRPTPKPTTRRTYSGGWVWPVPSGFISQYYHYGHWAIDIAADYGVPVLAARSGVVIFAGWKNNGGGWQVWISHGGGLYTTYNHMSALTVGTGQSVGGGQQVGRIGMTGDATGPHLHFEVWVGAIWGGGYRANPLSFV